MARNRKQRRQQHGSAWHWKQTDSWYFTEPGTKKRVPLFDEEGERIRGKENKEAARVALARIKVTDELSTPAPLASDEWTVAKACDVYLADLHRSANPEWATQVEKWLNDLCGYCGALKGSGVTLFRTTRGKAWKRCNCVQRFLELKKKLELPEDRCMYTCRHTFAKRTLLGFNNRLPLSNGGDTITLFHPDGEVVHRVSYEEDQVSPGVRIEF
jgi:hypothetical protein